jgi:membrane associated rhomboid family serine protease
MILPLGDDNRDRRTVPVLTYLIIVANLVVFFVFQGFGNDYEFTYAFSTVPEEILTGTDIVTEGRAYSDPVSGRTYLVPGLQVTPVSVYLTLIVSMFMHGGWAHLLGNMLFLWIFGDNVEDRLGRVRFILFYLVCGVIAAMSHVFVTSALGGDTLTPMLGASGAISGVLGGYLLLFPRKRVRVLILRFILWVPAIVAIGIWFAFQLVSGIGILGAGSQAGGVAYAAHVGGFVAGLVLVRLFAIGRRVPKRKNG